MTSAATLALHFPTFPPTWPRPNINFGATVTGIHHRPLGPPRPAPLRLIRNRNICRAYTIPSVPGRTIAGLRDINNSGIHTASGAGGTDRNFLSLSPIIRYFFVTFVGFFFLSLFFGVYVFSLVYLHTLAIVTSGAWVGLARLNESERSFVWC